MNTHPVQSLGAEGMDSVSHRQTWVTWLYVITRWPFDSNFTSAVSTIQVHSPQFTVHNPGSHPQSTAHSPQPRSRPTVPIPQSTVQAVPSRWVAAAVIHKSTRSRPSVQRLVAKQTANFGVGNKYLYRLYPIIRVSRARQPHNSYLLTTKFIMCELWVGAETNKREASRIMKRKDT